MLLSPYQQIHPINNFFRYQISSNYLFQFLKKYRLYQLLKIDRLKFRFTILTWLRHRQLAQCFLKWQFKMTSFQITLYFSISYNINCKELIQMTENIIQSLLEVNKKLGSDIFNLDLVRNYNKASQSCLIEDFHDLVNIKSFKEKLAKINSMSKIIAELGPFTQEEASMQLSMSKKTDITKFMTMLLIPEQQNRLKLEKIRKDLVVDIRKKKSLDSDKVWVFESLYKNLYLISQDQKEICQKDISQERENLKTLLMSLKKMMGCMQDKPAVKSNKQDTYSINLDIKRIIAQVFEDFQGTELGELVSNLVRDSQNKKWLGPRMHKMIQSNKWNLESTLKFIEALKVVDVQDQSFRSNPIALKKTLKKILNNLKKYSTTLKHKKVKKLQFKKKEQNHTQKQQPIQIDLNLQNFEEELLPETKNEKLQDNNSLGVMKDFTGDMDQLIGSSRDCYQSIFDQLCLQTKKPCCFQ